MSALLPSSNRCSALFKLSSRYSCELFYEDLQYDAQTAPRVRECLEKSMHIINDICGQVTTMIQELRGLLTEDTLKMVSPLMLHSIYTCAQDTLWIAQETNNSQLASAKLVSEDMLRLLDARWKLAGEQAFFVSCMSCLIRVIPC